MHVQRMQPGGLLQRLEGVGILVSILGAHHLEARDAQVGQILAVFAGGGVFDGHCRGVCVRESGLGKWNEETIWYFIESWSPWRVSPRRWWGSAGPPPANAFPASLFRPSSTLYTV